MSRTRGPRSKAVRRGHATAKGSLASLAAVGRAATESKGAGLTHAGGRNRCTKGHAATWLTPCRSAAKRKAACTHTQLPVRHRTRQASALLMSDSVIDRRAADNEAMLSVG